MTAGGTYRPGARVTTAEELDALLIGSVVRHASGQVFTRVDDPDDYDWRGIASSAAFTAGEIIAEHPGPLTVLFRPDAPQPDTTEPPLTDAEYRAMQEDRDRWRAIAEARTADLRDARRSRREGTPDPGDLTTPQPAVADDAVARVLRSVEAAIREMPNRYRPIDVADEIAQPDSPFRAALAAAGAGEAVDRGALDSLVEWASRLRMDTPEDQATADRYVDVLRRLSQALAVRGDAATPTVTVEQVREAALGAEQDVYGEHGPAVIDVDDVRWLTLALRALGIEVEGGEQPKPTAADRVSTIREALVEFMADELPAEAIEEWFDRWLADHDAQVAAEALRRKARAYRQAERDGYLFLNERYTPWEAVAQDLDSDAARIAAGEKS